MVIKPTNGSIDSAQYEDHLYYIYLHTYISFGFRRFLLAVTNLRANLIYTVKGQ